MDVQPGQHRGEPLAWLVHAQQLDHGFAQCLEGASAGRISATCAIVLRSTRAATGWRSEWYVSRRLAVDTSLTTWASFHPRFTAS